ncbi:hypothetical protein LCGC14_0554870 [marine sediment metagenome]|uniref:VWFA domain-containing protein n=1 Tax=marine sediment metagenome TaxID=412755 RepID=A0A0F9S7A7_9ZZZZ
MTTPTSADDDDAAAGGAGAGDDDADDDDAAAAGGAGAGDDDAADDDDADDDAADDDDAAAGAGDDDADAADDDAAGDDDAAAGGDGSQAHAHIGGDAEGEPEEAEDPGDEAQGGDEQGAPGNLDDFDIRDVDEIPAELLEQVLSAISHEMEDITRSVAEVVNRPIADVNAQTKKADYDGPAAARVEASVQSEIRDMTRVFDQQKALATRTMKGLTVGKLDSRSLARVGAGSRRVFKRREVLETPDLAVGLLLDVSGSMAQQMPFVWATACVFAEGLIRKKGINFLALTYTGGFFNVQTTRICDRDMGKLCLGNVDQGGGTPSGAAIGSMKTLMDRMPERQKVIIHFTDGVPDEPISVVTAVEACRKAGYQVWAISLHQFAGMLTNQYGDGNWETIGAIRELPSKVANLVKRLTVRR